MKRREIRSYDGSNRSERSVVSIVGRCFFVITQDDNKVGSVLLAEVSIACYSAALKYIAKHFFGGSLFAARIVDNRGRGILLRRIAHRCNNRAFFS